MRNFDILKTSNMVIIFVVFVIVGIVVQYSSYSSTKETIRIHNCVPTDRATQEFDGSTTSTTKVWYKCDDHGRWLDSYDDMDAIMGNN